MFILGVGTGIIQNTAPKLLHSIVHPLRVPLIGDLIGNQPISINLKSHLIIPSKYTLDKIRFKRNIWSGHTCQFIETNEREQGILPGWGARKFKEWKSLDLQWSPRYNLCKRFVLRRLAPFLVYLMYRSTIRFPRYDDEKLKPKWTQIIKPH